MENARRAWITSAVLLTSIGAAVGTFLWLRARPVVDEAEAEAAERWLNHARNTSADMACARAPLRGEATPGDGNDALRAALSVSRFCLAVFDLHAVDERLASGGPEEHAYAWDLPDEQATPDLPVPVDWAVRGLSQPPYPRDEAPPEIARILEACRDVPARIAAVTQHARVCSPFRVGEPPMTEVEPERLRGLARAIAVLARREVAAGRPRRGIEQLLDGLRFFADARRGYVSNQVTWTALDAEAVLTTQLATLFTLDLGLTHEDVRRLRAGLAALADTSPSVHDALLGERVHHMSHQVRPASGWEPPEGFDPAGHVPVAAEGSPPTFQPDVMMVAHHQLALDVEEACPEGASGASCLRGVRALRVPPATPAERRAWWSEDTPLLGPRELRDEALRQLRADRSALEFPGAVPSMLRAVATLRALRAVLAFATRDGPRCDGPPSFDPEDLAVPELEAPLEVYQIVPGSQIELRAPGVLDGAEPGTVRLPVVLTLCTRRTLTDAGAWFSHHEPVTPAEAEE